jgi:hypothetical protein
MASDEVQPVTAQQPIEAELNVLTMSKEQIVYLISANHLPDEENFDADSLLVVVRKIYKRATYIEIGNYVYQVYMFLHHILHKIFLICSLFHLVRRWDIIIVEH